VPHHPKYQFALPYGILTGTYTGCQTLSAINTSTRRRCGTSLPSARSELATASYARISVFSFRPTGHVLLSASNRKAQSNSQCFVLPRAVEGPFLASPKNPRPTSGRDTATAATRVPDGLSWLAQKPFFETHRKLLIRLGHSYLVTQITVIFLESDTMHDTFSLFSRQFNGDCWPQIEAGRPITPHLQFELYFRTFGSSPPSILIRV
jgi:hypothetical protein